MIRPQSQSQLPHISEQAPSERPHIPPARRATRKLPSVAELASGIRTGNRAMLARAISLVESSNPQHQSLTDALIAELMPNVGGARRVGITGVPGVGKSTFIETLGSMLTSGALGRPLRVAVLAIDPSSTISGGSILGDKTRMTRLSTDPNAFVRPSPSSGTLGGVTRRTRETLMLCEAFGFDVVLIETVGVGQSETVVAGMTDFFLALMLPGAGDELQGIKRGLLERADLVAINKADGDNLLAARRAAAEHESALRCIARADDAWTPPVMLCSARTRDGVAEVWQTVVGRLDEMRGSGALEKLRNQQTLTWFDQVLDDRLRLLFEGHPAVQGARAQIRAKVASGDLSVSEAATALLAEFTAGATRHGPGDIDPSSEVRGKH